MIEVVSDTSVAYQWFQSEGEADVGAARTLVHLYAMRKISLAVLDLARYELGNVVMRGRAQATARRTAAIIDVLTIICPVITPTAAQVREATRVAEQHRLTLYDAIYAAVARSRGAELATLDKALLHAGLGRRPSEIVAMVQG